MTYKIILPSAVWQDFNCEDVAPEPRQHSVERRGNITITTYLVTTFVSNDEKLRTTVKIYSTGFRTTSGVLLVPEYHKMPSEQLLFDLAETGTLVIVPDIAGNDEPATTFPAAYSYGNFENAGIHIKKVCPTPKETCQYLYSVIVKRVLAYARPAFNLKRIGLVGLGDAVEVAMQVAGSGTKIDALACLNGSGYSEYIKYNKYGGGELEMDEERMSWLSGVASVAYAKYITAPMFLALGTNSLKGDPDRLNNLAALLPDETEFVTVLCPRTADFLLPKAYDTFKIWLKRILNDLPFVKSPSIDLRVNEEGKIYTDITCDSAAMIKKVSLYYSFGEYDHRIRNWLVADGIKISQSDYISMVDATSADAPMFAFTEVIYENGIALTSLPEYLDLKGQPVKIKSVKPSRIIYDPFGGPSPFVEICDREFILRRGISVQTLPSGLMGLSSEYGGLKIYRMDACRTANAQNILQIDVYSEGDHEITVSLEEKLTDGIKKYTAEITVSNTKEHFVSHKMKLLDFKDEKYKPLTSWENIKSLEITGKDVIIGNILFI